MRELIEAENPAESPEAARAYFPDRVRLSLEEPETYDPLSYLR